MTLRRLAIPIVVLLLGGRAAAQPETAGPLTVATWDAGSVMAAGASIPTKVYYPEDAAGPAPVVIVMHGYLRNGSFMRVMAETLASRGIVAVVPDMPCGLTSCDHDANARQLSELLLWAVAQSGDASSPLSGRVDGERRGLVGHSWGGLAVCLATARDPSVDVVVMLDPNDDARAAVAAGSGISVANAHLMAEVPGACNGPWETTVYPETAAPKLRLQVNGSGHCDVEDPTDGLCEIACSRGDRATTPLFRRYAVAFVGCALLGDAVYAPYVGGTAFDADLAATRIEEGDFTGLDSLPCVASPIEDAGVPLRDAGGAGDAGSADDGGTAPPPLLDGGSDAGISTDGAAAADVGPGPDAGPPGGDGGCGCAVAHRRDATALLVPALLLFVALRRR